MEAFRLQDHVRTQEDDLVRQLLEANNIEDVISRIESDHHRHINPVIQHLASFDRHAPQTALGAASPVDTEAGQGDGGFEPEPKLPQNDGRSARRGGPLPEDNQSLYGHRRQPQQRLQQQSRHPLSPTLSARGFPSDGGRPLSPATSEPIPPPQQQQQQQQPQSGYHSRSNSYSKYLTRPYGSTHLHEDMEDRLSNAGSRHSTGYGHRGAPSLLPPPPPSPPRNADDENGRHRTDEPLRSPHGSYRRRLSLGTPTSAATSFPTGRNAQSGTNTPRAGYAYGRVSGNEVHTPMSDALRSWEPAGAALAPRVTSRVASPVPVADILDDPSQSRIARQLQLLRNYRELAELCSQTSNPGYNLFASIPPERLAHAQADTLRERLAAMEGVREQSPPVTVNNNYYFDTPRPQHASTETADDTSFARFGRPRFGSVIGGGGGGAASGRSLSASEGLRTRRASGSAGLAARPPLQSPQPSTGSDSPKAADVWTAAAESCERSTDPHLSAVLSPAPAAPASYSYGAAAPKQPSPAVRSPRSKSHRVNPRGGNYGGNYDDDCPTATTEEAGTSYEEEEDEFQGDFLDDDGDAFFHQQQPPRIIEHEQHRRFNAASKPLPGTSNVTLTPQFGVRKNSNSNSGGIGGTTGDVGNHNSISVSANLLPGDNSGSHSTLTNGAGVGAGAWDGGAQDMRSPSAAGRGSKGASMINVLNGEKELIADANNSHRRTSSFTAFNSNQVAGGGGGGGGGGVSGVDGGIGIGIGADGHTKTTPEKRLADEDSLGSGLDDTPFNEQLQTHNPSASIARKSRAEQEQQQRRRQGHAKGNSGGRNRKAGPGYDYGPDRRNPNSGRYRQRLRKYHHHDDMDGDGTDDYSYSYSSSNSAFSLGGDHRSPASDARNLRSGTRSWAGNHSNVNRQRYYGRPDPSPTYDRGGGGGVSPRGNDSGGRGNRNRPGSAYAAGNNSPGRWGSQGSQGPGRGGGRGGGGGGGGGGRPYGANGSPQRMRQPGNPHGQGTPPRGGRGGMGARPRSTDGRHVAMPGDSGNGRGPSPHASYPYPQQQRGRPMDQQRRDNMPSSAAQRSAGQASLLGGGGGTRMNAVAGDAAHLRQDGVRGSAYPPGKHQQELATAAAMHTTGAPSVSPSVSVSMAARRGHSQPRMQPGLLYGSLLPKSRPKTALVIAPDDQGHIHAGGINQRDGSILPLDTEFMDNHNHNHNHNHNSGGGGGGDSAFLRATTPRKAVGVTQSHETTAVVGEGRETQPLVWKSGSSGAVMGRNHRIPSVPSAKLTSHHRKPDAFAAGQHREGGAGVAQPTPSDYSGHNVRQTLSLSHPPTEIPTTAQRQLEAQQQQQRQRLFSQQQKALLQQQQQQAVGTYQSAAVAAVAAAGLNPNQVRYGGGGGSLQSARRAAPGDANRVAEVNAQRFGIAALNA